MVLFWILLAVLLLIAALICIPLHGSPSWHKNYRQQQNIALYQRQLQSYREPEFAAEAAQRLLDDEQATAKTALALPSAVVFPLKFSFWLWLGLCISVVSGYFLLPRFEQVQEGMRSFQAQQQKLHDAAVTERNDDYILSVQNRLRADPNKGEDWIELGRAYMLNNEFENALTAYANAEKLLGARPAILGLAATALYYRAGQKITPEVRRLTEEALAQDQAESSSLSLLASDAFLRTDYAAALKLWQQLLDSQRSEINRRDIIRAMQMAEMLQQARDSK
ncbi:cytochrome c-type biogenesis protein CcmH/formate-dependent nitrite reductase complex subunit NrfG [Mesocricetibacter intestinalis]|uniref:Cytochrome c-type biogenesis protein CcmH/formate-dependent nitrite reductase complex subunit NrfG n=1 Tax=Mesocricetibacter intestinalis TaxID=1521930 RepID=A0A4R6V8P5_9PAST|nr:hypothetical protein [Mesocricetibacter intestinalis]TDQ57860.1 cytochrome c-type biogenesis protein CcmH/formate-dependent nitrite reductase complex subunit NrfG [Mesocricetibacter intestinalis]